ncbi:LacI family DNA-binding transcriptional regulator [Halovulum marinum]|uniref:LacI family DNA-binding transcriptional regulator n=1 Tax=Halovulum marinum TaxID=2662447 RepID=UPI002D7992D0|nr:LacI family DNA-binding transcriptional regulator [Halovulum marinum]
MSRHRWVTMGEVAARAEVGKITVSRVIRTPDKVAPETRRRVQAAIRELGYVPDRTAGALSSMRSGVIGALVSTLGDSVFASTIDGLSQRLRGAGHELLLTSTDYDPALEEEAVRTLLGRRPDGLVLTSTAHTADVRRMLAASRVPVVEIWQMPDDPVGHVVGFSNRAAGHALTEYLIGSGRRAIAFLGGDRPNDSRGRRRAEGYAAALEAAGLGAPRPVSRGAGDLPNAEFGARALREARVRWPDLDAVICVSDPVAVGALCEARRTGLSVPDGLAVAGFGGLEVASEAALDLTTVAFPGAEIGRRTAEILLHPRDHTAPQIVDLGFRLIRRATA